MEKREFQTESKRLLELMIHSIYTNKEIFLRELISNASDATDKRYFQQAETGGEALNREELPITIAIDKENRQLTITDHGIGMTAKELESNLGTIAQSGSLEFKEKIKESREVTTEDVDIIGQFGVGFYSSFMVADQVVVSSCTAQGEASRWESSGVEGYVIHKGDRTEVGTEIRLTIKENKEEDDPFDDFLDEHVIKRLVQKYSDYIRYPIQMMGSKSRLKEGSEDDYETVEELETLNSRTPLWKKQRSAITSEEYNSFYKEKFHDFQDPLKVIHRSTEGISTFDALLFIPATLPMNYHSKDYKKGLQLYASGVLIMEYAPELLPDYFGFVKGVVDSQDLNLNISREMLQQDRQLVAIRRNLEKRIHTELEGMLKNQRESYVQFFEHFGISLKYGIYEGFGRNNALLQDLLLFHSSAGGMRTLAEYIIGMPEDQKYIYYATGENIEQLKNLPAGEAVKEKGYEILYFTDQVDEFLIQVLRSYDEKEFRSITGGDIGLETSEEKEELEKQGEDAKELLEFVKNSLEGKVHAVTLSPRLKSYPACLTSQGEVTLEMEKTFASMPGGPKIKAERVLEINPEHELFEKMKGLINTDKETLKLYSEILYGQSLLLEGLPLEDPTAYVKAVNKLMG